MRIISVSKLKLLVYIFSWLIFFGVASVTSAATKTWDFSAAGDYTYNNSLVEFSSGQVQLKTTSNWYSTSWKYRRSITIDNTSYATNLTNFQINLVLTSANFDFSKADQMTY